jgi:hypothetical protein
MSLIVNVHEAKTHFSRLLEQIEQSRSRGQADTHRWRIAGRGQSILGACVRLHYHGLATAA